MKWGFNSPNFQIPTEHPTMSTDRTFKDKQGISHELKITLVVADRINASDYSELTSVKFDAYQPPQEFFAELIQNRRFAAALAFTILHGHRNPSQGEGSLQERLGTDLDVDDETLQAAFLENIDGDALEGLCQALWGALADFTPSARTALLSLRDQRSIQEEKINQAIQEILGSMEDQFEDHLNLQKEAAKKQIAKELSKTRGQAS